MLKQYFLFFLVLLLGTAPFDCQAMSWMQQKKERFSEAMGVSTLHYRDKERNRPITVEIWYPTDDLASPLDQPKDSIWIHPKEMRDVELSTKHLAYPLVIMSHGHKGDRRERSWLADLLVHRGFVVASIEHFGNAWSHYTPLATFLFWERAKDVSFIIDALLAQSFLKDRVDMQRIGFVGYSLGGMTGLALAGATAQNAEWIARKYQREVEELPDGELDQIDFSQADLDYHNSKIKSMLLICPATFVYPSEGFSSVKIPIGLIASKNDEILPHKEHASRLLPYLPSKRVHLMKGPVSHYAFLNCLTEKGMKIFQQTAKIPPQNWDWKSTHREAGKFAVKFFEETLQK